MPIHADGFFVLPITSHDWIVITIAALSILFRVNLLYRAEDEKDPSLKDWIGLITISTILTICAYEVAIAAEFKMQYFYISLSIIVISAREISDWLFMSKDGRSFILNTVKVLIRKTLANFGFEYKGKR